MNHVRCSTALRDNTYSTVVRDLWQCKQTSSSGCGPQTRWFTAINPWQVYYNYYLPFWAFTCVYVHATSTTYSLRKLLHKFIFQHICPAISVTTYTQTGSGNNQYIFIKLYDIDYEVSMYTFTISYKVSSWNTTWKLDQCTKRKHRQLCKFPTCFINSIFPWPKFIP